jgi:hypothetical protein
MHLKTLSSRSITPNPPPHPLLRLNIDRMNARFTAFVFAALALTGAATPLERATVPVLVGNDDGCTWKCLSY